MCAIAAVIVSAATIWWFTPGQQQKRRDSTLIVAARAANLRAAEAALDAGADVNARDAEGITPLMHAARGQRPIIADATPTDHPEMVELLLRRGADVNARTGAGLSHCSGRLATVMSRLPRC
jgi:ankyrin repeat protein